MALARLWSMPLASLSVYLLAEVMASNRSPPCGRVMTGGSVIRKHHQSSVGVLSASRTRTVSLPFSRKSFFRLLSRSRWRGSSLVGGGWEWGDKSSFLILLETSPPRGINISLVLFF